MSIITMYSFETGANLTELGLVQYSGGGGTGVSTSKARTQSRSLALQNYGAYGISGKVYYSLPTAVSTVWAQLAYYSDQVPNAQVGDGTDRFGMIDFWSGGTQCIQIGYEYATHKIIVAMHDDLPIIASSDTSNLFTLSAWQFIEAKLVVHDTAGSVLVKVNGITVLDETGLDTKYSSYGTISRVMFGSNHTGLGHYAYMDDIVIGDGDGSFSSPPGDSRIEYLAPIAAGNRAQFTPSTGSNWSNVDELGSANDSDYNYSADVGATDVFAMSNLATNGTVHAVQSLLRARKDDAGLRLLRPAFYKTVGSVGDTPRLYAGSVVGMADSFARYAQVVETSPDTGVAWTVEEIADLQFGYMVGGGNQFSLDCWIAEF